MYRPYEGSSLANQKSRKLGVFDGPRPLNSTRRHGPFWGLVTCDMGIKMIVTWDMIIS